MARKVKGGTSSGTAQILVVDDDERNLLALSEVLGSIAKVVTASSGQDALRLLLKQDFAVILLDVFMPGLDGYETAALIREREQTARIPIIFVSAVNKETEHLVRGYEMGAVDYVFKPVDPLILKSKVSVFVDLYNMRRQIEEQAEAEAELREANYREQLSRIEVERELEVSQMRQAAVLQALPIVLYMEEPEVAFRVPRYVAGNFESLTGYTPEEVAAEQDFFASRLHPDDREAVERALEERNRTGTMAIEYRWKCRDGNYRYFFDQTVEIPGPDGQRRLAGTFMDVSDRKLLETKLLQAQKMDALGKLTGGVAHDFNNLLAAMLGGLHVIERRLELGPREKGVVDQMRHAVEQGTELVKRMMAFARQQELTPSSVDPAALCDSVAGLVSHSLGGTVVVNWACPAQSQYLFVDRGQLELALMTLIINARDAMPDGGEIDVAIEPCDDAQVGGSAICVSVTDKGVGMAPDILAKVAEPFFTTKEAGKGTGLGLSMVAGFAEQSGGRMQIDSAPDRGTRVELILPATSTPPLAAPGDSTRSAAWLAGNRVMLIDDDDSVRLVLAEQLRDFGATVDDFDTGEKAIATIRAHPKRYDFVLSDFAMPHINGLDTLREIGRIAPGVRRFLMTGYADDSRIDQDCELPVLRKPIDIARLRAAVAPANAA